jgi:spore coat protein U-like protein
VSLAPDVGFGQAPTPGTFASVQQAVSVVCTKGLLAYSIGLGAGQHAAAGRRRMAQGGQFLEYDIFKGATSDVWGTAGADRVAASLAADGLTPQDYVYRATVYPNQASPPAGTYVDTIVIDLIF